MHRSVVFHSTLCKNAMSPSSLLTGSWNSVVWVRSEARSQQQLFHRRGAGYVPYVVKRDPQGGGMVMDIFSRLQSERVVMISGPISDATSSVVTAQLLFLESENPEKPVQLYINSPGGSVTAGLAIYDTMRYIKPDVHTLVLGQACSMGALLLAGGDRRIALPHARIMVHQPSGGFEGTAGDMHIQTREILRLRDRINNIFAHHTKQSVAEIEKSMERDNWMDAKEGLKYGIIDEIVEKRDVAVLQSSKPTS